MKKKYPLLLCFFVVFSSLFVSCEENEFVDQSSGDVNGHKYVDLGLPSGIKWATCNVGAINPWDYGDYYAWGETYEKDDYTFATYKWCDGSFGTMFKYTRMYPLADNKTELDPDDDVARVKWGGGWRMPTMLEQLELVSLCTFEFTTVRGIDGYAVTGPNGNSIFIPNAGYRAGTKFFNVGDCANCWSSSLKDPCDAAFHFDLSGDDPDVAPWGRIYGLPVRPVCE